MWQTKTFKNILNRNNVRERLCLVTGNTSEFAALLPGYSSYEQTKKKENPSFRDVVVNTAGFAEMEEIVKVGQNCLYLFKK